MISERMKKFDVSLIRKMFDLGAKLKNPVNLSIGMPDFDVLPEVKEAMEKAVEEGANKYTTTQGLMELRKKISQKLKRENGIKASADDIIITCGVGGALDLAFRVLLNPGDEVLIPDPSFGMYREQVKMSDAAPVPVDTYPDFQLTAERILSCITEKTRILIVNTPNNPTGEVYPREELKKIAELAKKKNLIIISDEIYEKFVYEGEHVSIGSFYENTVTVNGLSKSAGMTGWRLGYAAGPGKIIQEMCKLQQYTYVCAPSVVQRAAIIALDSDISEHVKRYDKNRKLVIEKLSEKFKVPSPGGAFYFLVPCPEKGQDFVERMLKKNLMLVPGAAFSERDTHFRITYSVPEETLAKGLEILTGE